MHAGGRGHLVSIERGQRLARKHQCGRLIDANDRGYTFSLPTVKFSDAGADVTGSNTDTMVSVTYQATLNDTEDCTTRMQRWA